MKKRVLAFAMAGVMVFGLMACGGTRAAAGSAAPAAEAETSVDGLKSAAEAESFVDSQTSAAEAETSVDSLKSVAETETSADMKTEEAPETEAIEEKEIHEIFEYNIEAAENSIFHYRYADADEAAELLLSDREYYEHLSQNDLNYRMQKQDATLEELEEFTKKQTLSYTDEEKAAIDGIIKDVEKICAERGYNIPVTDGIVFAKTTMDEEFGAMGYTHGTQIYLGSNLINAEKLNDKDGVKLIREVVVHELFHCLTRNHSDFRKDIYGLLGFTVQEEDFTFSKEIQDNIFSNPDVEHHNSYASFNVNGKPMNCAMIFLVDPFEKPGDKFMRKSKIGLVPIDDLSVMYTREDADNFEDVVGRNTTYVIDPEECLADNFSYVIMRGTDPELYETPKIIEDMDHYLKSNKSAADNSSAQTVVISNREGFSVREISDELFERMKAGNTYKEECIVPREDLRYLLVLHKDKDGNTRQGEMVVHKLIAEDVLEIFEELYDAGYPIERMVLPDNYMADDETMMRDNNSSSFNFRFISHTDKISKHGLGMAVDINTLYNPYHKIVENEDGTTEEVIEPATGEEYLDRTQNFDYKINKDDLCYKLFTEKGFEWGGDWTDRKDYQHFELPTEITEKYSGAYTK